MATFVDAVLQPALAAVVFGYQDGVYADVAARFRDFHLLVDFEPTQGQYEGVYCLDPVLFSTSYRHQCDAHTSANVLSTEQLCLNLHNTRDPRFPLHLAIVEGDLAATKSILRCRPDLAYQEAIDAAIQHDHLDIATYLLEQRVTHVPELNRNFDDEYHGQPSRLLDDWLPSSHSTLYKNDVSILALLWAHRQRDWDSNDLVFAALEADALEALGFLIAHLPPSGLHGALDPVAGQGHLPLVKALHARESFCTTEAMDWAAANGHLDVVTFLHEKRSEGCTTKAMNRAAANGHLDVVTFLHEKRSEGCTTKAMNRAAANGHLDVVTFLHEKRTEGCTMAALSGATVEGHLDVVLFLVEHRDDGASHGILDSAAADGYLDLVTYLNELGRFPCTTSAVDEAAKNGHLDVVDYLLTNRREGGSRDDAVRGALDNGHIEIVQRLVAAGYSLPTTSGILNALRKPRALEVMQYYVAQGIELSSSWARDVPQYSNNDIAQFYFQHAPAAVKIAAPSILFQYYGLREIQTALSNEDFDLVSDLRTRQPELRHDHLLEVVVSKNQSPKALAFLLDAGVGQPRSVAVKHIHRRSFEMMTILLPYCLHPNDPVENLVFLVEWVEKQSSSFTKSFLVFLKAEIIAQATAANCRSIHAGTEIEALTEALLERGATTSYRQPEFRGMKQRVLFKSGVADWGLATLFVHFFSVDAIKHADKLLTWLKRVTDVHLKAHLQHLFAMAPDALVAAQATLEAAKWAMSCDY
ncbi:hypothetical protein SPRG_02326 [Saprolegnia parasitica CBS 223.65]|uniref:Uncharacterized protein n=1 Tax=Saprolegnia parasitica (strain CBS 223.65) TaxID=695850 RepID=A0A067CTQ7_SAPPC|nr:hypothetical protein SPRG_02326 [Saprolegnia parasitica CBS 223.65]KDO32625.1 hypothetical protein SPRG_02326 [Saprolegnia parasitica CBS 223.65]|eukprot:XP_012196293.1 hypothetical protein SPRG_02326 [Saprolegnia parasitica CBS 223.65]